MKKCNQNFEEESMISPKINFIKKKNI